MHRLCAMGALAARPVRRTRLSGLPIRPRARRRGHQCRCHSELGAQLGAGLLDPQVAYLTGDHLHSTPLATVFEVRQQLSAKLRALRKWVRDSEIGVLEIKKRGIDIDPAVLRKQLKLDGPNSATMIVSRRGKGALVAIVERV